MIKMRKLLISGAALTTSLGLMLISDTQTVVAEGETPAVAAPGPVTGRQVIVTSNYRKDTTIMDIGIQLGADLQGGSQAKINLLDANKQVINTIDYTLASGQGKMTAWFDMKGYPAGQYSIQVTISDKKGNETVEADPFTYPLN